MIRQGNIDLDEYGSLLKRNRYYMIEIHNDHEYSTYPLGASIMALPIVFLADHQLNPLLRIQPDPGPASLQSNPGSAGLDLDSASIQPVLSGIEAETTALIIALTAVFIFLIGREYLDRENSLLLSFIFAFCTSAWSTGSRSLMQHGPSMMMLTLALYLLTKAGKNPRLGIIFTHRLLISFLTPDWWGGYSFGNRFFSDLVPFFVFFLIPVIQFIPKIAGWKQIAFTATFVLLVFASFFIHIQGANSEDAFLWNAKPADVDRNPS